MIEDNRTKRLTGRTTRAVDLAIQILFTEKFVQIPLLKRDLEETVNIGAPIGISPDRIVLDPSVHDLGANILRAQQELYKKVAKRLRVEHEQLFRANLLKFDANKGVIILLEELPAKRKVTRTIPAVEGI